MSGQVAKFPGTLCLAASDCLPTQEGSVETVANFFLKVTNLRNLWLNLDNLWSRHREISTETVGIHD